MMVERQDFTGVHEPFSYLAESGGLDLDGTRLGSVPELLAALRARARRGPVFVKETTGRRYPEVLADRAFLARDAQHTFLIRHPRETIASRYALDPGTTRDAIGFESLHEVFTAVTGHASQEPVVLDSGDLIARPAAMVAAYCAATGIGFRPDTLTWPASDRPEWARSRRWHAEAAASTAFGATGPHAGPDIAGHPVLSRYLDYHLPFYEQLYQRRLRV